MDEEKNIDLLAKSVRQQRQIAQGLLDQAKKIDDLIQGQTNPESRKQLETAKGAVINLARELIANATATSTSAQSAFELISNLAKK